MISEVEALQTIAKYRRDYIIIHTFTTIAGWPEKMDYEIDLPFTASFGKGSSFALGLALARPDKKFMVLDGDGGLLSNLGTLLTVSNMAPPNLVHFVFENSVWETTGGQPLPAADKIDMSTFAKSAGYLNVYCFDSIRDFREQIEAILDKKGPTFISLKVARDGKRQPMQPKMQQTFSHFRTALEKSNL